MNSDRSKNDLIMLGAVAVLGILAIGMVVAAVMDRDIPDALSSLSVGVLGAVAGYVTAGRSKPVDADVHTANVGLPPVVPVPLDDDGPGLGLQIDPGIEGDEGPEYGHPLDDWFDDEEEGKSRGR